MSPAIASNRPDKARVSGWPGSPPGLVESGGEAVQQAQAQWKAGMAHQKAGRHAKALSCFESATRLAPRDALYWINLSRAQTRLHHQDDALASAQRAWDLDRSSLLACQLLARQYRERGQFPLVIETLKALPDDVQRDDTYHVLLGGAYAEMGKPSDASRSFLDALTCKPDSVQAHMQLGFNLARMRQHAEAAECFRTVLAIKPHALDCALYALHYAAWACDWDAVDHDRNAVADCMDAMSDDKPCDAISPFCLLSITDDAGLMRAVAEWDMRRFHPLPAPMVTQVRTRLPGEPLRVGMVSCDFHHHATSMLLVDTLEKLDRSKVSLHLFSHGPEDGSPLRQRIKATAADFVECRELSTERQAALIKERGIDVLIDLKGYTLDTRISVFSYRPAPVQVTWLGYPGTCGAPFIDYVIGDAQVTPLADQWQFSEAIAQMPHCYQPNDSTRGRQSSRTRQEVGLPEDAVVLASFNQSYKLTREVFDLWCSVLRQCDQAVLWMLVPDAAVQARLRAHAERQGVAPDRLYFSGFEPIEKHRQRIGLADLHLDTFPCGGHTTCSDALWGGLPVVAWQGHSFASRVAPSLLATLGLSGLVVDTPQAYEALAIELIRDDTRRKALRQTLLEARDHSSLYDAGQFAHDFVQLLERMWQRAQAGLPPEALPAEPAKETA